MRCAWVLGDGIGAGGGGGELVVLGLGNIMYVGCEPFLNEDRAILFFFIFFFQSSFVRLVC